MHWHINYNSHSNSYKDSHKHFQGQMHTHQLRNNFKLITKSRTCARSKHSQLGSIHTQPNVHIIMQSSTCSKHRIIISIVKTSPNIIMQGSTCLRHKQVTLAMLKDLHGMEEGNELRYKIAIALTLMCHSQAAILGTAK